MNPADAFLHMRQVRYAYPGAGVVIDDVDWSLPEGAIHCLLGRSGCGKSTLLKLAAGLLLPDSGEVVVGGMPVREPGLATGFVFQAPTLLAWLSVLDNVLLPVSLKRRATAADITHATELLEQVGLQDFHRRYPDQLSGGQQSRVAIARALLPAPRLLLMDEPFAALDALTREELQDTLLAVCRRQGTSVLFVTHDIAESVYLGDRVAVIEHGQVRCTVDVPLPRPRLPGQRHGTDFNAVCARLRQVMEGVS